MYGKNGLITEKVGITPNEVTDFYNAYKFQLPQVKDEVVLSKIAMYPKLTDAHKDEIINKLKKIKQDILAGESFENKARIYSEDPGSASNGGEYKLPLCNRACQGYPRWYSTCSANKR